MQVVVGPHVRVADRRRDQFAAQAGRFTQRATLRHACEERVGPGFDAAACELVSADLAAEPLVGFEERDAGLAPEEPRGAEAGDAAADDRDVRHGYLRRMTSARTREESRVVVEGRRPGEGDAQLVGDGTRLHVEVVQHFEVVGHEAARAHDDVATRASCITCSMSGPIHRSWVRPTLCHATCQSSMPAALATADAVSFSCLG